MTNRRASAALALSAAALGACGGGAGATSQTFPLELESDTGALHVEVHTSPEPPVRGSDTVELLVTRTSDGSPVEDLELVVQPWMPAMNHGTSATPSVTQVGGGRYRLTNVYLYMPGLWELRTTFTGSLADHAAPALDIP